MIHSYRRASSPLHPHPLNPLPQGGAQYISDLVQKLTDRDTAFPAVKAIADMADLKAKKKYNENHETKTRRRKPCQACCRRCDTTSGCFSRRSELGSGTGSGS